jgi:hypothetical protein
MPRPAAWPRQPATRATDFAAQADVVRGFSCLCDHSRIGRRPLQSIWDASGGPKRLGPLFRLRVRLAYSLPMRFWRGVRPTWLWLRTNRVGRATQALLRHHPLAVSSGPFTGMRYPQRAVGHASYLGAKLIGAYEYETYDAIAHALSRSVFINVGAAEGYFAIGVAMRSPNTQVFAFEVDSAGRRLMRAFAEENDCAVMLLGKCDPNALNRLSVDGDVMLWVDVEGYERELLDPELVPMLRRAAVLVECHPSVDPSIPEVLEARFASTHRASVFTGKRRDRRDFPVIDKLSDEDAELILLERLGTDQTWNLYLPYETTTAADASV